MVAESRELQQRVCAAINALPEADRLPVMLFYLSGYAQQEIATIMELPLTTIKKRLFHARQRLRVLMADLVREQLNEQLPAHDAQFARTIQFFIAVRIGDIANVRAYLDQDPGLIDAHERWDEATALRYGLPIVSSFTALHRAAYNNDAALVAFLLERRAEVDSRTRAGQTPLHIAVQLDHPAIVALLLAGAADPNAEMDLALTPLHYAVMLNRPALAQLLLAAGADVAFADKHGRTPLDWALLGRIIDATGAPLDDRGPINAPTQLPIDRPAGAGPTPLANQLLETGIKVIDLFAPIVRGGTSTMTAMPGVGLIVTSSELIQRIAARHGGCAVIADLEDGIYPLGELVADLRSGGVDRHVAIVAGRQDETPEGKRQVALAGLTLAEHFCEQGCETLA